MYAPTANRKLTESSVLAGGYAIWLASYPLLLFVLPNDILAGGLGLCIGIAVNFVHLMIRPQDIPVHPTVWIYIGLFGTIILISQLIGNFSGVNTTAVIQCGAMIIIMFIAGCIANPILFPKVLRIYAVLISAVLVMVIIDGDYVWGRLFGRAQPNFWGMMALSAAISGLAFQKTVWKVVPIVIGVLVLYLTNSRGSIISTFIGLLTAVSVYLLINGAKKRLVLLSVVGVIILVGGWAELSSQFISNQILQVDDPRRGLDSGFTGRLGPWIYALQLSAERPIFGYGYRASEFLFKPIGVDSVHNGYLSMLLDTGVFGLVAWLAFLAHTLFVSWMRVRRPVAVPAVSFVVSYAVLGLVERYALNAGQPTSILFLVCAMFMLTPNAAFQFTNRRRELSAAPASVR